MTNELFADMIGEISLVRGAMRIDLVSMSAAKDEQGNPVPEFRQRIVMPLEGFVQSFGSMERMMAQLVERGVISKNADEAPEADAAPVAPQPQAKKPAKKEPSSPNF
ncbi:MAG: hypothetical protein AAF220_03670 [Pseudomonadota bacterium]